MAKTIIGDEISEDFRYFVNRKTSQGRPYPTPLYRSWVGMKNRCYNTKTPDYRSYGARGIYVCDRWRWSFDAFIADMLFSYEEGKTLDRVNNDGPYSPENCRWATKREQNNNQRKNRFLEWQGQRHTLAAWARIVDIPVSCLMARLDTLKWPVGEVLGFVPHKDRRGNVNKGSFQKGHEFVGRRDGK